MKKFPCSFLYMKNRFGFVCIITWLGLVVAPPPSRISGAPVKPACPRALVEELGSLKAGNYVIWNCVVNAITDQNFLGELGPGPNGCLTNLIKFFPNMVNQIPRNGACREAIQTVVAGIIAYGSQNFVSDLSFNSDTGLIVIADHFLTDSSTGIQNFLFNFQIQNGISAMHPQCPASLIRARSHQLTYTSLVTTASVSASSGMTGTNALCNNCYQIFFDLVRADFTADPILSTTCGADPHDPMCRDSSTIEKARDYFLNCAGYDIEFLGPVCTQSQVVNIEALNPAPYYVFMQCAFENSATTKFCNYIDSYIKHIGQMSNEACSDCYYDFYRDMLTSEPAVSSCSSASGGSVWSQECIAAQAHALNNFRICSGTFMNVDQPPERTSYIPYN